MKLKSRWMVIGVIAPLLAAGLLALACGGDDDESAAPSEAATNGEAEEVEVVVTGTEFAFEPSEIRVKEGQRVKLVLQNEGQVEHDLQINGFPAEVIEEAHAEEEAEEEDGHMHENGHEAGEMVHVHAMPGHNEHIEFMAEETGEFEIICTIPGHADAGMVGTLIVE